MFPGGPIDVALMSHSNSTSNTINTTTTPTVPVVAVLPSDDVDSVLVELQRRKNSHEGIVFIYNALFIIHLYVCITI